MALTPRRERAVRVALPQLLYFLSSLSRRILSIPIMVFKNLQSPARQATATSNWLSCQSWQVHGMDLVSSNASRMDRFKSSGRVPHERRDLHALRPFILTLLIDIVMIHVRIFIFLLHSHARFLQ